MYILCILLFTVKIIHIHHDLRKVVVQNNLFTHIKFNPLLHMYNYDYMEVVSLMWFVLVTIHDLILAHRNISVIA